MNSTNVEQAMCSTASKSPSFTSTFFFPTSPLKRPLGADEKGKAFALAWYYFHRRFSSLSPSLFRSLPCQHPSSVTSPAALFSRRVPNWETRDSLVGVKAAGMHERREKSERERVQRRRYRGERERESKSNNLEVHERAEERENCRSGTLAIRKMFCVFAHAEIALWNVERSLCPGQRAFECFESCLLF